MNTSHIHNITLEQPYTIKEYIFLVIQSTVALISLITNSLLIIAIATLRSDRLNYSTRWFLVYHTGAHLLLSFLVILKLYPDEEVCAMMMAIGLSMAYLIGTGMLFLSLDSFITMMKPFTYKLILTRKRVKVAMTSAIAFILVLMTSFLLTGQPLPRSGVSCNINDIFLTPHHVILFCNIIQALFLASAVFQTWTLILVKRMNTVVAPVASASGTSPTVPQPQVHVLHVIPAVTYSRTSPQGTSPSMPQPQAQTEHPLDSTQTPRPSTSTDPSQDKPTKHGPTDSHFKNSKHSPADLITPEVSTTDVHNTVTIHMYHSPSEMEAANQSNQGLQYQRDSWHQAEGTQRTPNRRTRLMRLLASSLLVILICWPQLEITCTIAAVLDLYGIDRTHFDYWRLQMSALAFIEGGIYPMILIALSSELRDAVKSLILNKCLCFK